MQFVNFSNHRSAGWSVEQRDAALSQFGADSIVDVPFPIVKPEADEAQVLEQAKACAEEIAACSPAAVMAQGEFGLVYAVVGLLKEKGIPVVYACSERVVRETTDAAGNYIKEASFVFVRFRRY